MTTSNDTPLKQCRKCLEWKPATAEFFHRNKTGANGLHTYCKACVKLYTITYYQQNKEKAQEYRRNYIRQHPDRVHEANQKIYYANQSRYLAQKAEYTARTKEQKREYDAQYRREHAEKVKVKNANRIARQKGAEGKYTVEDIELQYRSQNGLCWWCGCELNGKYHIDHRIPLSKGGSNYPRNLCCACSHCNLSKHHKMPWEFNGRLL